MSEVILGLFNADEQSVLLEMNEEFWETLQSLPIELYVDDERIGEVVDE